MAANDVPCCESMFWVYLIICVALVAFAGLMSGLTLGLMSLSLVDLEVLIKAGEPQDRKNAEKILPIVKNQHLLLCTLLICNALAMEALPIFVDSILPAWAAILISVTLILAFGEIIPQAVCSRYGLSIGAKLSVVVRVLVIIFFPLSYPISKLLDLVLGKKHSALLRRAELKTLVDMHGNEAGNGGELTHDETTIISGALNLAHKTAKDAMTPISTIFSIDLNAELSEDTMSLIMSKGHSRVPVYSGSTTNIIGLILVKNLIKFRAEDATPIRNLTIRRIPKVDDNVPLYDILNQFQKGHSHMAVVIKSKHNIDAVGENGTAKSDFLAIRINSNSPLQNRRVGKGSVYKSQNTFGYPASVSSSEMEIQNPASEPGKKGYEHIVNCVLESLQYQAEEAIGIITMEDVLEELLQEQILDETDEYIDVHDKIKINIRPPMQSSSRSPGAPSRMMWRSPEASPFSSSHATPSSKHHTPVLHSPISPYVRSPIIKPTLNASPGKSVTNSPSASAISSRNSPSSHLVSRKEYEKLRKADDP